MKQNVIWRRDENEIENLNFFSNLRRMDLIEVYLFN